MENRGWVAKKLQSTHDAKDRATLTGVAPRLFPLTQAFEDYLARKDGLIAAESFRRLKNYCTNLLGFFRGSVQELSSDSVADYARERLKVAASKTVRDELLFLKGVLKILETDGLIEKLPY